MHWLPFCPHLAFRLQRRIDACKKVLFSYVQCAELVNEIHELSTDEAETVMKQVKNTKQGCYLGNCFAIKAFQSVYVKVCMVGPIHYNNFTFFDKNKIDL